MTSSTTFKKNSQECFLAPLAIAVTLWLNLVLWVFRVEHESLAFLHFRRCLASFYGMDCVSNVFFSLLDYSRLADCPTPGQFSDGTYAKGAGVFSLAINQHAKIIITATYIFMKYIFRLQIFTKPKYSPPRTRTLIILSSPLTHARRGDALPFAFNRRLSVREWRQQRNWKSCST